MSGLRSMPVLACADPEAVGAFLADGLGFAAAGWWRDEAGQASFGIVSLGTVTLALQRDGEARPPAGWAAYVYVEDAREFAVLAAAAGVTVERGPEDTRYACREVEVRSPEGHLLCFAQDLAPGPQGPGL